VHIVGADLANELRDINRSWTRFDARRVAAKEASICFCDCAITHQWQFEIFKRAFSTSG
jgi:hypothetical protein